MKNTKIEWCDHTFNPWIGCTKVSPGCANCYAEAMDHRWGHKSWGPGAPRRRTSAANWKQPLKWNEHQEKLMDVLTPGMARVDFPLPRPRVFCGSLCDWLDDEVPIEWLSDLLELIRQTPNLDWLLLTKRPQNWRKRLAAVTHEHPANCAGILAHFWLKGTPPENVCIGTTVEDQPRADERIPPLLQIPARVHFLSCEPLLSPVELRWFPAWRRHDQSITALKCDAVGYSSMSATDEYDGLRELNWVICGGESGPKARPMHPDWARSLRDQCQAAGVAFFFKQWGNHDQFGNRTSKYTAGRLLDGREWNEFPK